MLKPADMNEPRGMSVVDVAAEAVVSAAASQ
jgi:hypothetical protein